MASSLKQPVFYQKTIADMSLENETIKNKEFEECKFVKVYLTEVTVEWCKFINCTFDNCILSAIKPTNCTFSGVEFKDSKVIGCDWTLAKNINSLAFSISQISYSNFRFLKLPELKLINCVAKETDFTEADLRNGNFSGTDFEGARFLKTNLTKANFKGARNYFIDIRSNVITKAKFSYPEAINLLKSLDITLEY